MALLNPEQMEVTFIHIPTDGYDRNTKQHVRSLLPRHYGYAQGREQLLPVRPVARKLCDAQRNTRLERGLDHPGRPTRGDEAPVASRSPSRLWILSFEAEREVNDIHHAPLLGFARHLPLARPFPPKIELRMVDVVRKIRRIHSTRWRLRRSRRQPLRHPDLAKTRIRAYTRALLALFWNDRSRVDRTSVFVFVGYLNHDIGPLHLVNLMPLDESPQNPQLTVVALRGPITCGISHISRTRTFLSCGFCMQVLRGSHSLAPTEQTRGWRTRESRPTSRWNFQRSIQEHQPT
ncbi:hypothetical protein B0T18DRAFT_404573 [Schizothecium vesticola]|uniref:Uncharacterized protein n=1 Tax=Schizothecium vesticola TaxID=314040 RepID=A0AA40F768_9PEZI|nr:hypothetical protein B0T18DRAFT_404573 [Schizothecium vesticola]